MKLHTRLGANGRQVGSAILIILAALAVAGPVAYASGAIAELTGDDQARVSRGETVLVTAPGQDSAWPMIRVYQRLDATPEDAAAVYSDYNRQHEYLPGLTYSKIIRRINPATVQVSYCLQTHFMLHPKENYTLRNQVASYDDGSSYRIDWELVSADDLRGDVGAARFEPLGTGALLAYSSFVTPPSIAGGQGAQEAARVRAWVAAIAERVRRTRVENGRLLQSEILSLRAALGF